MVLYHIAGALSDVDSSVVIGIIQGICCLFILVLDYCTSELSSL